MKGFFRNIGRLFGLKGGPNKLVVVGSKSPAAVLLSSPSRPAAVRAKLARAFQPVAPRSLYVGEARGSMMFMPRNRHRPSNCRGRCNRKHAARKAKARR